MEPPKSNAHVGERVSWQKVWVFHEPLEYETYIAFDVNTCVRAWDSRARLHYETHIHSTRHHTIAHKGLCDPRIKDANDANICA